MATFIAHFTAYTSDTIEFEFDGEAEDIDEMVVREHWDCLPLINGYTTDWDNIEIESVEDAEEEEDN